MTIDQRTHALHQAAAKYRSGQLGEAEQLALAALRHNKNDVAALQLLASIATDRGALDVAANHLLTCVKLRSNDALLRADLATVLAAMGQLGRADEEFEKALKLAPALAPAIAGRADVLNRLGQADHALELAQSHLARSADSSVAIACATILRQKGRHAEAIEIAQKTLDEHSTPDSIRREFGFLLGACHEHLGNYDIAFEAIEDAHQIGGQRMPFNIADYSRTVDGLIAFFTPSQMKLLTRASKPNPLPVFIAGMARSGTTLVEQIIHAHPQASGAGEVAHLDVLISSLNLKLDSMFTYPRCLSDLTVESADHIGDEYIALLRRSAPHAARIVDKNLRNIEHLGLISLLFSGASIIHCKRDPLDVCLSCFFSPLSPVKHPYATKLRDIGLFHREYVRLMNHWENALQIPKLSVQYEALVADQERISREIIAHCGLSWDENCLRYYEKKRAVRTLSYDQVRRPMYDSSVGRHKHFEKQLGPLREALEGR